MGQVNNSNPFLSVSFGEFSFEKLLIPEKNEQPHALDQIDSHASTESSEQQAFIQAPVIRLAERINLLNTPLTLEDNEQQFFNAGKLMPAFNENETQFRKNKQGKRKYSNPETTEPIVRFIASSKLKKQKTADPKREEFKKEDQTVDLKNEPVEKITEAGGSALLQSFPDSPDLKERLIGVKENIRTNTLKRRTRAIQKAELAKMPKKEFFINCKGEKINIHEATGKQLFLSFPDVLDLKTMLKENNFAYLIRRNLLKKRGLAKKMSGPPKMPEIIPVIKSGDEEIPIPKASGELLFKHFFTRQELTQKLIGYDSYTIHKILSRWDGCKKSKNKTSL